VKDFPARRRAIEHIGLPAGRNYRLAQLDQEECSWREQLEQKSQMSSEMVLLLLIRLDGGTPS